MDSSFSMDKARIHCQTRELNKIITSVDVVSGLTLPLVSALMSEKIDVLPEFDSYFWAKARPALSLSPKIFTVNVA